MCDKKTIDRIESGQAIVVDKKRAYQWGAATFIFTILIWIISQSIGIGGWKAIIEDRVVVLEKQAETIKRLEHNLIRLFEKQGVEYNYNVK
jgi:hypothetical protein